MGYRHTVMTHIELFRRSSPFLFPFYSQLKVTLNLSYTPQVGLGVFHYLLQTTKQYYYVVLVLRYVFPCI